MSGAVPFEGSIVGGSRQWGQAIAAGVPVCALKKEPSRTRHAAVSPGALEWEGRLQSHAPETRLTPRQTASFQLPDSGFEIRESSAMGISNLESGHPKEGRVERIC